MKGIYVIKDKISEIAVTDLFTCENDKQAIVGFNQFLNNQKIDKKCFVLVKVGSYNKDTIEIVELSKCFVSTGATAEEEMAKIIEEA